jgi:hypothetical protein
MSGERGLDFKALTYLLGLVAMFAGFATMVFGASRLMIDLFGGAVLLGGFGSTAWATGGMSRLKMFVGVLVLAALIGGAIELVWLKPGR